MKYEEVLRERERNNPKYAFLIHRNVGCTSLATLSVIDRLQHRRHAFYRGLVESDRILKPEFDDDVSRNYRTTLQPPNGYVQGYNSIYSSDSAEESERERGRRSKLGKLARKRFEAMLRGMSGKRGEIARCMAFSLEHAEAAHEVAIFFEMFSHLAHSEIDCRRHCCLPPSG